MNVSLTCLRRHSLLQNEFIIALPRLELGTNSQLCLTLSTSDPSPRTFNLGVFLRKVTHEEYVHTWITHCNQWDVMSLASPEGAKSHWVPCPMRPAPGRKGTSRGDHGEISRTCKAEIVLPPVFLTFLSLLLMPAINGSICVWVRFLCRCLHCRRWLWDLKVSTCEGQELHHKAPWLKKE